MWKMLDDSKFYWKLLKACFMSDILYRVSVCCVASCTLLSLVARSNPHLFGNISKSEIGIKPRILPAKAQEWEVCSQPWKGYWLDTGYSKPITRVQSGKPI